MVYSNLLPDIFCTIDEFVKEFNETISKNLLENKKRNRSFTMSDSEIMTILVLFHLSGMRCFKHFYLFYVRQHLQAEFPKLVSYNRFVELTQKVVLPLSLFAKTILNGKCSGISFIDSTSVKVCNSRRIQSNKVFKDIAKRGKTTMGWFYGFKLHLVINDKGEILNFAITTANVDDRNTPLVQKLMTKIFGKLYGDRGYLSANLFELLFNNGIHLITKIKKNMKNQLMTLKDKILLRKRAVIESVNDELKNICQIEHSRHRSPTNFFSNLIAGIVAYGFLPKKPSINIEFEPSEQLSLYH